MNTFISENISSTDVSIDAPTKVFNHIQKYYELKTDYYNFLAKKGPKKYTYNLPDFNRVFPFKTSALISKKSNLPLQFSETKQSLIITLMDHEQKTPLREISIKIKDETHIDIDRYNIKKELLLFKLNSIKTKKLSIDANKDREHKKEELAKLSVEWDTLKTDIATFQSKFSAYKIRKKQKERVISTHHQYNIDTNDLNNYNELRTDLLIRHLASSTYNAQASIKYYVLLKFLSYLNPTIRTYPSGTNNLCLIRMEEDSTTHPPGDSLIGTLVYKKKESIDIHNIYVVIKALSKKSIKVVDIEGQEEEFSRAEYGKIVDRVNVEATLLKQLYEDANIINMNQKVDAPICKVKELNPIPSSYSGLVYSGKSPIMYIPPSRIHSKKKKKIIRTIQEVEELPKYKLLDKRSSFDSFITYTTDELFIYRGAATSVPGNLFLNALTATGSLKKEKCSDEVVQTGLKGAAWREILSVGNRYIHKSNGEVLPIIIDSMKFSSVGHYLLYNKYKGDGKENAFLYGGVLGTSHVSIDEALYEDYTISSEWESVDDSLKIKKSSICLAKAHCAKYIQFHEYKLLLFATNDAKLIVPVDGNTSTGEYQIEKELIMVRTLLRSGDDPLFYMTWNDDFVKSVHIHKAIMSRIIMPDPSNFIKKPKSTVKTSSATSDTTPSLSQAQKDATSSALREYPGAVATKEDVTSEASSRYTPPMSPLLSPATAPTAAESYPDTAFDYRNHYTIDDNAKVRKMLDSDDTFNFEFQTAALTIDINSGKKAVTIDDFHNISSTSKLTFTRLESYHDYIQWLFPNSEASRFNSDSRAFLRRGELEMLKTSQLAKDNMLKSLITMTKFYGGELHLFESLIKEEEDGSAVGASASREQVAVILPGTDIKGRLNNLNAHTHNQSRITRILKYLGEMGSEHLKIALIEFLIFHICHNPLRISWKDSFTKTGRNSASLVFWINTVYDDEERERLFNSFRMCYGRDRKIRAKLLKGLPKDVLSEWQVDEEGSYSQTSWTEAETITGLIVDTFRNMFRVSRQLNIVDATASIGGNVVSFLHSDEVASVLAIEPNNTRVRYLDINIDTFIRHMDKRGTKKGGKKVGKNMRDKIRIVNESFDADTSILVAENIFGGGYVADIVFIDPPWGGVDYATHHNPARVLGDVPLEEICGKLLYDTSVQLVVLKLPTNFLIEDFTLNLAEHNILISQLRGRNITKMNIYIVYLDTVYVDDDDERLGEELDESKKKRQEAEAKYQGGGRRRHRGHGHKPSIRRHSTFPYTHGKHKYHMACRHNREKNSQELVGFYNSKRGDILYRNECQKYEVLRTILDALIQKCEKKEIDLAQHPMKKIPYLVNPEGMVILGEREVGRLIGGGRIEFL